MKNLIFILLSFFLVNLAFAQPANDNPCAATNMGNLPTPGPCVSGLQNGAVTTLTNQSTVGATGASPYVYQTGCSGGGQQAAPALDTWYTFTATGNQVNVAISGFPNASVAIWTGSCNNLTAWGCMNVPAGGNGNFTVYQTVIGQQYWIEVSGGNATATDANFSLSVDNDIDCNNCLQTTTLTANPAPVNGGYTAGQVVNFCFTVNGWNEINTNWFHGVQITMGAGWTGTFSNLSPAANCPYDPTPGPGDAGAGTWAFYNSVTSSATGQTFGQGFYFDNANVAGTNPGQNFGDPTNGNCTWTFCWSLTVGPCTPGMNLNVTVNTTGDGESGSWNNPGCAGDAPTTFSAVGVCCIPPVMTSPNSATICSGGTVSIPLTATPASTFSWIATANANVTGESTTAQTSSTLSNTLVNTTSSPQTVVYTVTPTAGCPGTPQTVNVLVNPTPVVTAEPNINVCAGATVPLNSFASATAGTTFAWTNSNTAIGLAASGTGGLPSFTATNGTGSPITSTITVTPTANGCPGTPINFTITVNPMVTPTFTALGPFCSGTAFTLPGTSTNSITGTWSPAVNNTATTTYTFTPTAGQCATTTTMTVTINPPVTPTFAAHPPICSGGTITLPTTSTNGFTGTWSPAPNNTATTTYTFTPTAGQCATTTTMTVTVGAPTTPTFTAVAPICSGGSFTLPTTSNNGFTGTWSPAINNTATTTYTFTPTAGQCATTTTMTVTVNAPVTPTFTAIASICSGGSFTLPTTSTNGFTGTWSPAINNTATTTYTFTPTAGQCATTTTMTVTVNPNITPTFNPIAPICSGDPLALPGTSTNAITGTWSPAVNNTATTTYTFTPTAGQCATTTTLTVTVNAPTTPTFNPIAPICSGDPLTLPGTSTNGFTGTWSPAINNSATTTYTFTPSAGQCATTTTLTVSVGAPVTPTFTAIAPICSGDPLTLPTTSNNAFTGTWSPAINNTATTTYTFTPTAGQCATTTTMTVTVNAPVTPTFTAVAPICSGGSFTLPTTSNNGFNGTWSPAINNTATTTYTFTPTAGQCATTTTMTVTVNPIPVVDPIANIAVCDADPVAASNFTSTPLGSTFAWTNTNTSIGLAASGTGNTPAFTATNGSGSPVTSTVSVTPTLNGCVGTAVTYTITVNNQFDATITPVGPFCANATSVTLTAVDAGGTWSGNGITNAATGTFDPASAGVGTHTITYTIAGSCGDTQTTTIVVNPIPVVDPIANIAVCDADPVAASNFTSTPVGSTFAWTNTNTSIGLAASGTGNTPAFTATNGSGSPVTSTVSVTPTLNGCVGTAVTYTITINNQFDATITPVGPFCANATSVTLTAVDAGGTWSGNGITNAATGTFDPATAGVGTHTITYTIAGSCGDTQTTTIVVNPMADASITPAGPFCGNDPAVALVGAQGGGTWSGTGITNPALGIFDPSIAGLGTHTITYTIAGPCGDTQTTTIIVSPNMNATITPVGPFCENQAAINLSAVSPGGTWSGTGITNAANGTFNPATAGPGTHTITYTIAGNCGDTQTTTIVVNPLPTVSFSVDNASGCVPLTVTFTDNSGLVGGSSIWSVSNGANSTSNGSFTTTFNNPGCFNVTLQLTSAQGCISSVTQNNIVCVSANPVADFVWSPTNATVLNSTVNFTNTSTNATSYVWDFDGLGSSTQTNPSFTFPSNIPGFYNVCLAASNAAGCVDTTCHLIEIFDEFIIYVPNAFTPDGDGLNDIFIPIVNGHDPLSYELLVFNRWGELIFQSQHSTVGWDGTYKSVMSQEDVYVWKVKVKDDAIGQQHDYIGHVTLLR